MLEPFISVSDINPWSKVFQFEKSLYQFCLIKRELWFLLGFWYTETSDKQLNIIFFKLKV